MYLTMTQDEKLSMITGLQLIRNKLASVARAKVLGTKKRVKKKKMQFATKELEEAFYKMSPECQELLM